MQILWNNDCDDGILSKGSPNIIKPWLTFSKAMEAKEVHIQLFQPFIDSTINPAEPEAFNILPIAGREHLDNIMDFMQ